MPKGKKVPVVVTRPSDLFSKNAGYKLGLVMNKRQEFASYSFEQAMRIAAREKGENALRGEITTIVWGPDGQQVPQLRQNFTPDAKSKRAALAYAKKLVEEGQASMVHVQGETRRTFAQRGFGDRAIFELFSVEKKED
jgi:hypothetical protein